MEFINRFKKIYFEQMWTFTADTSRTRMGRCFVLAIFILGWPMLFQNIGVFYGNEVYCIIGRAMRYICYPASAYLYLNSLVLLLYLIRRFVYLWHKDVDEESPIPCYLKKRNVTAEVDNEEDI